MKKLFITVVILVFVLALTGCNKGRTITGDTTPTNEKPEGHLLTVTADGESIHPYQHFLYSEHWDGEYFVSADGVSLTMKLSRLVEEGLIPQLNYAEDITAVVSRDNAEIKGISLYDSKFEQLEGIWDISDLSGLDDGEYYVGINVNKQGEYIKKKKKHECSGYAFVFKLCVGTKSEDKTLVGAETSDITKSVEVTVSYANYTDEDAIYSGGLNADKMTIEGEYHFPIYKFDSVQELEQFKKAFGEILTMDYGYDENPSFNEATAKYDEAFFKDNTLMLVYVTAGSGSLRFGVGSVTCDGKSFCIDVKQTNNPEVCTDDMAGWFITVAVADSVIANCTEFDAR